jgi:hypothetical protein
MRVRATARFFEDLDRPLPSERGQRGDHQRTTSNLRVAPRRRNVRRAVLTRRPNSSRNGPTTGSSSPRGPSFSVLEQLASDGAVELIQLDIDLNAGDYTDMNDDD